MLDNSNLKLTTNLILTRPTYCFSLGLTETNRLCPYQDRSCLFQTPGKHVAGKEVQIKTQSTTELSTGTTQGHLRSACSHSEEAQIQPETHIMKTKHGS